MLEHIHIENFRLFKKLDIPKLGQVNLISGKNNCGKTTLLEALRLWANRNSLQHFESTLFDILSKRGDLGEGIHWGLDTIFFNHDSSTPILFDHLYDSFTHQIFPFAGSVKIQLERAAGTWLTVIRDVHEPFHIKPSNYNPNAIYPNDTSFYIPVTFSIDNAALWKKIELTDKEDDVAKVLNIIEPDVVRVSINERENSAKVRLKNSSKPVPLKNFGEGMNRLLAIALGLVSAEDDMLLIDEIDLGLHHSVQPLMWEIVFQTAKRLNVQVFATTHSSDCVRSFADMANKPEFTGMGNYLRLQKSAEDDGVVVVDYDMEELETALELNLETR